MIRLTETQKFAVRRLQDIPPTDWKSFMYGHGKYRVAIRALVLREPGLIEIHGAGSGAHEAYRLTPKGRDAFANCAKVSP